MGRRVTPPAFFFVSDTAPRPRLGAFVALAGPQDLLTRCSRLSSPFDVVPDARGAKAANLKAV